MIISSIQFISALCSSSMANVGMVDVSSFLLVFHSSKFFMSGKSRACNRSFMSCWVKSSGGVVGLQGNCFLFMTCISFKPSSVTLYECFMVLHSLLKVDVIIEQICYHDRFIIIITPSRLDFPLPLCENLFHLQPNGKWTLL